MTHLPRSWAHIFCLWLSLATVLAHAVLPVGSAIAKRPGSAFSISTTDVALSPSRRVAGKAKKQVGQTPSEKQFAPGDEDDDLGGIIPHVSQPALRNLAQSPSLAFRSGPLRQPIGLGFRPRAPPLD